MQMSDQPAKHFNESAFANPLLEAAMARLVGKILARHFSPLNPAAENPQHSVQHCSRVMPRKIAIVFTPCRAQDRLDQFSLFVCQFTTACHRNPQRRLEQLQARRISTENCL
jgi:hypothetical protein